MKIEKFIKLNLRLFDKIEIVYRDKFYNYTRISQLVYFDHFEPINDFISVGTQIHYNQELYGNFFIHLNNIHLNNIESINHIREEPENE